jgi:Fe2+ or Zn2+ uptake regulation protein
MGGSGTGSGDAVELLRGQGMRMTPQRLAIVDEIMSTAGYIIPTTVIERVQAKVPGSAPPPSTGPWSVSSRSAS